MNKNLNPYKNFKIELNMDICLQLISTFKLQIVIWKLQQLQKIMLNYSIKNKPILVDSNSKGSLFPKENINTQGTGTKRLAFKPTFLQVPKKEYLTDTIMTPKTARTVQNTSFKLNSSFSKSNHVTPDKQKIKKQLSFAEALPSKLQQGGLKKIESDKQGKRVQFKIIDNDNSQSFFKNTMPKTVISQHSQQTMKLRQTLNINPLQSKNHLPPKPIKTMVQFDTQYKQNDKSMMRKKIQSEYSSNSKEQIFKNKFVPKSHTRNHTCTFQEQNANCNLKLKNQYSQHVTPRISQEKLTKSVNVNNNPMTQTDPSGNYFQKIMTKRLSSTANLRQKVPTFGLSDFQLGSCKGEGRFGKVFPAIHKKTGFLLAIKQIRKQSVKLMLEQFIQQLKISLYLNHSNVVKMYGFFYDHLHFYILMEYMEQGSLYKYIKMNKKLEEEEVVTKLIQICQGLGYLHSLDVLHRDIKPQNIVLSNGVCKICDFGWAIYSKERRTTYCGTLDYVCPEILQGESYDNFVDIWAIGVLAYEMLAGKAPFYHISRQQTMKSIMKCNFIFPEEFSRAAKSFITKSLQKNPDKRLTIQQLLKDNFLNQKKN